MLRTTTSVVAVVCLFLAVAVFFPTAAKLPRQESAQSTQQQLLLVASNAPGGTCRYQGQSLKRYIRTAVGYINKNPAGNINENVLDIFSHFAREGDTPACRLAGSQALSILLDYFAQSGHQR